MAELTAGTAGADEAPARRRLPSWLTIALVYVGARIVTTGFLVLAARMSLPSSRVGADAAHVDLRGGWDAAWYAYNAAYG